MKRKKVISITMKIVATIALCIVPMGCSGRSTSEYYSSNKLSVLSSLLDNSYLYGIEASDEEIGDAIYTSYVGQLGNNATYYLNQESFKQSKASFDGNYFGTGLQLRWEDDGTSVRVLSMIEGSPAEEAGIKVGDHIVKIDGIEVSKANEEALVKKISTPTETAMSYTIIDSSNKGEKDVSLQASLVELKDVKLEMLDQVAYIKVEHIKDGTSERLESLLKEDEVQKAPGIILDVRGLYTNNVEEVSKVADLFLEDGIAFKLQNKGKEITSFEMTPGAIDNKLIILTDSYTSGCGEALVSALKERATQIGADTFGLSYVSEMIELEDGSGLCIATGILYDQYGEVLSEKGIEPTIRVYMSQAEKIELIEEGSVSREKDSTLAKALEQFKS